MTIANIDGKIWMALQSRLQQWSETPIALPYDGYKPNAGQAFVYVDPVTLDIGDNTISHTCGDERRGFINLRIMTPLQWAYPASSGMMGRVSGLFPAGLKLAYDDATVEIYRHPQAQGTPRLEVSWNRQDIRVYWRCWG